MRYQHEKFQSRVFRGEESNLCDTFDSVLQQIFDIFFDGCGWKKDVHISSSFIKVFKESLCYLDIEFSLKCNQDVFAVVTTDEDNQYRLSVFSDEAVPLFGPSLPCPPVFSDPYLFR